MKSKQIILLSFCLIAIALGCQSQAKDAKETINHQPSIATDLQPQSDTLSPNDYVPGELLVTLKNSTQTPMAVASIEKHVDIRLIKVLMDQPTAKIAHFKVPEGQEQVFISELKKNKHVQAVELNIKGKFIHPIQNEPVNVNNKQKSTKTDKNTQQRPTADDIVGLWEVNTDLYMAVYEVQKYQNKYVGLVHYYNDGQEEVKGDGSEKFYFMENVTFINNQYEKGIMHLPDGSKCDVTFKPKNKNTLIAEMTINGQSYTEDWKRKENH